jgi:hypothetical protein
VDTGTLSDFDKAEKAAGLFAQFVAPLLDRYMQLKAQGADAPTIARARRVYERAHGKHNSQLADMELEDASAQLTRTDAGRGRKDQPTHG